jgi:hypothetical protein
LVVAPVRKVVVTQPLPAVRPAATHPAASPPSDVATAPATTNQARLPSAAPAAANCDPPFWIDADGTKRYNRHCANL